MNPFDNQQPTPPPPVLSEPTEPRKNRSWVAMFSGLAWIVLCFELGAFLVVYPWMNGWEENLYATLNPQWHDFWLNPWLRGAVSGLGAVNLIIALVELFRYLKHWLFD